MFAQLGDDLKISLNGTTDNITVKAWFKNTDNQVETIKTQDGSTLINSNMQQLIQAMATFGQDKGMDWSDAINQKPDELNNVLNQYWVNDDLKNKK